MRLRSPGTATPGPTAPPAGNTVAGADPVPARTPRRGTGPHRDTEAGT